MTVCMTDTYILMKDVETNEFYNYQYEDSRKMYLDAVELIAYSDCSSERVIEMVDHGLKVKYFGWRPDMRFTFQNAETGEVTFDERFPSLEH